MFSLTLGCLWGVLSLSCSLKNPPWGYKPGTVPSLKGTTIVMWCGQYHSNASDGKSVLFYTHYWSSAPFEEAFLGRTLNHLLFLVSLIMHPRTYIHMYTHVQGHALLRSITIHTKTCLLISDSIFNKSWSTRVKSSKGKSPAHTSRIRDKICNLWNTLYGPHCSSNYIKINIRHWWQLSVAVYATVW